MKNKQAFIITGTGTGIGKTYVMCQLLKKYGLEGKKVLGIKPVASGCEMTQHGLRNDDALQLMSASNMNVAYDIVNPLTYTHYIAPHIAAKQDNHALSVEGALRAIQPAFDVDWDILLIEGVGGWLVPFNDSETFEDFAIALNLPVILVVGIQLGCINHGLLTFNQLCKSGVPFHGWIANVIEQNMPCMDENIQTLAQHFGKEPLVVLPFV